MQCLEVLNVIKMMKTLSFLIVFVSENEQAINLNDMLHSNPMKRKWYVIGRMLGHFGWSGRLKSFMIVELLLSAQMVLFHDCGAAKTYRKLNQIRTWLLKWDKIFCKRLVKWHKLELNICRKAWEIDQTLIQSWKIDQNF